MSKKEVSYIQIGTDKDCVWCEAIGDNFNIGIIGGSYAKTDATMRLTQFRATQLAWFILEQSGLDMIEFVNHLINPKSIIVDALTQKSQDLGLYDETCVK